MITIELQPLVHASFLVLYIISDKDVAGGA